MPDERDAARDLARDAAGDAARDAQARAADHAGVDRLAGTLIPALMAKLGTLNVGELEVREGDWKVRLRRPAGATPVYGRRAGDRPSRSHPGHEQHGHAPATPGHAPATPESHRAARPAPVSIAGSSNGSGGPALAPVGPGRTAGQAAGGGGDGTMAGAAAQLATSPAVGVFQPGPKAVAGTRVRAGDRLGVVDMLGVPQEVVAPADGIVVGVIVDAGTAVEYGQELVHLEPAAPVEGR